MSQYCWPSIDARLLGLQLGTQPTGKYALQSIIKRTLVKVCKRTILGLKSTAMLTDVSICDLPTLRALYFYTLQRSVFFQID